MLDAQEQRYRATAEKLAIAHHKEDPLTKEVYLFPDPKLENVRLLEVSGSAPSSGDVLPFGFAAHPDAGVPFASTVILLSLDEWKSVKEKRLELPSGWELETMVSLPLRAG